MKPTSYFRHLLSIAGSSVMAISFVSAQTNLFWDQDAGATTGTGGTGTWNTTSTWRSGSSTGTLGDWSDGNIAVFGGTAGTVTLSGPVSAAGLTFSTTGYTITGSTLTLTGTPVISAAVTTSTISSDIAGTNGLEKTGAGTLILSGTNNTYSGTTTISAGTLQGNKSSTSGPSPFGTSTIQLNAGTLSSHTLSASDSAETYTFGNDINVGGNATIDFRRTGGAGSNKTHAYGNLSIGNNTLALTAAAIGHTLSFTGANLTGNAIINNGTNATLNIGAITETGGPRNFTKQGAAVLRLTGNNTYTGSTTISAGTLQLGLGGTTGSLTGTSGITNDGNLTINRTNTFTQATDLNGQVITGTGSFTQAGTGITVLTGDNTYTGQTSISAGTLVVSKIGVYGADGNIGMGTAGTSISMGSASSLVYTGGGETTDRSITFIAAGTGASNSVNVVNNGTGALNFTATQFNTGDQGANNRYLTLGGTNGGTISGAIRNFSATSSGYIQVIKNGTGTWTMAGSNTYVGDTTLNAGTLRLDYHASNTSKLSDLTGTNLDPRFNGGTLELYGGSHTEIIGNLVVNGGTTFIKRTDAPSAPAATSKLQMGTITFSGGAIDFSAGNIATTTTGTANTLLNVRATVAGANFAMKDGTNTNIVAYDYGTNGSTGYTGAAMSANINYELTANGASTLAGTTGATSNTLKIANTATGSLAVGTNTLTIGAILFAGSADYDLTTTGTGRITPSVLHNYGTGGAVLNLGALGGFLSQYGTGTTVLTAAAQNNAGVGVYGGTVQISNNNQIGTPSNGAGITLNNGTLLSTAAVTLNNSGSNSRNVTLGAGGGTLAATTGNSLTVTGVISGTASQLPTLTIGSATNEGTVTLSGVNTYNGRTFISGGTLSVGTIGNGGVAGNLGQASNLAYNIVFDGGTLAHTGASEVSDRAFTITAGKTATINTTNNLSLAGATGPASSGALTKTGNGTLTLTGTSTYTGSTNVSNGTLIVNGSISNSSLTTVASGATIGGSGTIGALTVSSGGFINPGNSPGTLDTGNFIQAGLYTAEITGLTPDTQHDQINVTGTVNIAGGSLTALFSAGTYSANDLIFILLNDGTDAITGTYTGLAQGTTVTSYGGFDWQISYTANNTGVGTGTFTGGNDIALIAVIPEPSVVLLSSLGVLLLFRRRR